MELPRRARGDEMLRPGQLLDLPHAAPVMMVAENDLNGVQLD